MLDNLDRRRSLLTESVLVKVKIPIMLFVFQFVWALPLGAGVSLLVGEPYGKLGFFNPTGHAAVYVSNVCAETPTQLRLCRPGETGVVLSRYNHIGGFDWIAIPLMPYLYAVERPQDVPQNAEDADVARLRENYRRARLQDIIPDDPQGGMPEGDWVQLIGSAYERNIYGFSLETEIEDDERLIQHLNSRENRRRFNLIWRNCADFAREIMNFYYPGSTKRNIIGDFGIMTPKNAARTLVKYSQKRPELSLAHFVIPQVPGRGSSTRLRGVAESLIRSKKYAVPLAVLEPWAAVSAAAAYLAFGRFNPEGFDPACCEPSDISSCVSGGNGASASEEGISVANNAVLGEAHAEPDCLVQTVEQSENSESGADGNEILSNE